MSALVPALLVGLAVALALYALYNVATRDYGECDFPNCDRDRQRRSRYCVTHGRLFLDEPW